MATLRCTAKLLKRLGIRDPGEPPSPSNALGDWFANFVSTPQSDYLIFVNERSLLPMITAAGDLDNVVPLFLRSLRATLNTLDVSDEMVERELNQTEPLYFGKTNSRVVLGSLTDFVFLFRDWSERVDLSIQELSLKLGQVPCSPIGGKRPADVATQLLRNPHSLKVVGGGKA